MAKFTYSITHKKKKSNTLENKTCHAKSFYYILNKSNIKRIKLRELKKIIFDLKGTM